MFPPVAAVLCGTLGGLYFRGIPFFVFGPRWQLWVLAFLTLMLLLCFFVGLWSLRRRPGYVHVWKRGAGVRSRSDEGVRSQERVLVCSQAQLRYRFGRPLYCLGLVALFAVSFWNGHFRQEAERQYSKRQHAERQLSRMQRSERQLSKMQRSERQHAEVSPPQTPQTHLPAKSVFSPSPDQKVFMFLRVLDFPVEVVTKQGRRYQRMDCRLLSYSWDGYRQWSGREKLVVYVADDVEAKKVEVAEVANLSHATKISGEAKVSAATKEHNATKELGTTKEPWLPGDLFVTYSKAFSFREQNESKHAAARPFFEKREFDYGEYMADREFYYRSYVYNYKRIDGKLTIKERLLRLRVPLTANWGQQTTRQTSKRNTHTWVQQQVWQKNQQTAAQQQAQHPTAEQSNQQTAAQQQAQHPTAEQSNQQSAAQQQAQYPTAEQSNQQSAQRSERAGKLLAGICLGDRSGLEKEVRDRFNKTGAGHVLAVSGLHVGALYGSLVWILGIGGRLRERRRYRHTRKHRQPTQFAESAKPSLSKNELLLWQKLVLKTYSIKRGVWVHIPALILIWAYALVVGLSTSVVRAALMLTVYGIAKILGHRASGLNVLCIAALVLVIIEPKYLFDLGFQLSFTAVLSLILFFPLFRNMLSIRKVFPRYLWELFCCSLSVQIGTLWLTWGTFGTLPVYSLFCNMIIVPLATLILYSFLAYLIAFCSVYTLVLLRAITDFMHGLADVMDRVVNFFLSLPFSVIDYQPCLIEQLLILWCTLYLYCVLHHRERRLDSI